MRVFASEVTTHPHLSPLPKGRGNTVSSFLKGKGGDEGYGTHANSFWINWQVPFTVPFGVWN
jgi:hypothetical protein